MIGKPELKVYPASEFEQKVVQKIVRVINEAVANRGTCLLALAGGETPKNIYHALGTPPLSSRVPWNSVHLFFTDERVVPPDHQDSNYGMVFRELISRVSLPPENVHRIAGEKQPDIAAQEYQTVLQQFADGHKIPQFDLILLGIGEDGHTASIFSETTAVDEQQALAAAVFVPKFQTWRITLTLPVINHAQEIFFLATGEKKSAILQHVLSENASDKNFPATLVHPEDGKLFWMLDEDAAGNLKIKY
ncbi:MAG TPA: 6-phosphogluconolactonase [Bacteroidota bacterium]|nr:6-phosphogluconolactonase [Bacteroidota bacterium]